MNRAFSLLFVTLGLLLSGAVFAGLPAPPTNTGGANPNDMLGMSSFLLKKGLTLAVYVVGAAAFIAVVWNAVQKLIEWRQGRAEFGDFMSTTGIGAGLLVLVGIGLTVALDIINSITV